MTRFGQRECNQSHRIQGHCRRDCYVVYESPVCVIHPPLERFAYRWVACDIGLSCDSRTSARIDFFLGVVRVNGNIDNFVAFVTHFREPTDTMELTSAEKLALPSVVSVFAILVVDIEQNGLDDSPWTSLEVLVLVDVLISAASAVACVRHFQQPIHEALSNTFAGVARVDEEFHLKGVAEQACLTAIIIQVNVTHDFLGHITWRIPQRIALRDGDQVWKAHTGDAVDSLAHLSFGTCVEFGCVDSFLNVIVVYLLRSNTVRFSCYATIGDIFRYTKTDKRLDLPRCCQRLPAEPDEYRCWH